MACGFSVDEKLKLYQKYTPLLRSISSRYWRHYRESIQSYQDLYQTVCYLFLYALDIYKPEKGKLGPHLKRTITLKLNSMLKGERAPRSKDYPFTFLRHTVVEIEE